MLKNVFNFKWLQVVFFAGCATGAVAGALAGMGMGFGAGLLLAQKPGKDLRDELTDKTLNMVDGVKTKAGEVKEKMDTFVSSRQHDGQFESNS
jgi:gas vesicle protein